MIGIAIAAEPDVGIIEYSVKYQPWQTSDLYMQWSKDFYVPWYDALESELKDRKQTLQFRLSKE